MYPCEEIPCTTTPIENPDRSKKLQKVQSRKQLFQHLTFCGSTWHILVVEPIVLGRRTRSPALRTFKIQKNELSCQRRVGRASCLSQSDILEQPLCIHLKYNFAIV